MTKLFGLDIAKLVADSIKSAGDVLPATLIKVTAGTRTTPTGGTHPTEQGYPAKGVISDYTDRERAATEIKSSERKILLLGASLPPGIVPVPGDKITIEDRTYRISVDGVSRDAASAAYRCRASG